MIKCNTGSHVVNSNYTRYDDTEPSPV